VNLDPAMLAPLLPVLLLAAVLIVWALIDIIRRPAVRHLPRWAWALIVLLAVPLGAVLYLVLGRVRGSRLREEDLR
jgi:membrane protein implicated in regulation of membrane protease activity